jgi:hypothetical protein
MTGLNCPAHGQNPREMLFGIVLGLVVASVVSVAKVAQMYLWAHSNIPRRGVLQYAPTGDIAMRISSRNCPLIKSVYSHPNKTPLIVHIR